VDRFLLKEKKKKKKKEKKKKKIISVSRGKRLHAAWGAAIDHPDRACPSNTKDPRKRGSKNYAWKFASHRPSRWAAILETIFVERETKSLPHNLRKEKKTPKCARASHYLIMKKLNISPGGRGVMMEWSYRATESSRPSYSVFRLNSSRRGKTQRKKGTS